MITQEMLRDQFEYNLETGELIRRYRNPRRKASGTLVCKNNGTYKVLHIRVNKQPLLAHRVIWMYMTGYWPDQIDHINHDATDNRWANLRNVNRATNKRNCKKYENNSTGITGVHLDKSNGRYRASIAVDGKSINLYSGKDLDAAIAARQKAELRYGFHPNHGR